VDVELELAEDVLLVPLVLLVEEVALDDVVASALPISGGAPGGGPPAGGAPRGDPWGGPAFSIKAANSDFETDPSPSLSMALKRSSKDEVFVLSFEEVVDEELLAAAWLALASSLFEIAPSPSLSRSLSIFSAMRSAIFLRSSEKSIELAALPILETDIWASLGEVKWSDRVSSPHRANFRG
jgi:hypothetical protein